MPLSKCLIISDLHLSLKRPELIQAFESFISRIETGTTLIIAGDFFDFFVGVDKDDPLTKRLKHDFATLNKRGVDVAFQCGNRDYLLTKDTASFFGMRLLPQSFILDTPSGRALLIHGDILCADDKTFMRFRALCLNPIARAIFFMLPFSLRRKIGQKVRSDSAHLEAERKTDERIFDLSNGPAGELLRQYNCEILIHGHFHIFGRHKDQNTPRLQRLALGAWGNSYSFVKIDENSIDLIERPLIALFNGHLPN